MNRLLFIDDEPEYVADYIDELKKRKFRVDFCQTAEESVEKITGNYPYDAVVLDSQMPPPNALSPSVTNYGIDTGLWVLGEARETILSHSTPVVILTNRNPIAVRSSVQKLGLSKDEIEICRKQSTPYEELPNVLSGLLPQLVESEATLLRRWNETSCAVAVNDERVGWLEFDIPARAMPKDIQLGDRLTVVLKVDRHDDVISYQIPADTKVLPRSTEVVGEKLTADIPKPPSSLDDAAAMAQYRQALAKWARSAGLK